MKESVDPQKRAVRSRDEIEKFSEMRFKPSMRKRIAPKKKDAPTKSIWGREKTFESLSKKRIDTIKAMPIGKLM